MKRLTIKIERRLVQLAETETQGKRVCVNKVRAFPLPESLQNGAFTEAPEELAAFIAEALRKGRLTPRPAALLFDSSAAIYHEYRHRKMPAKGKYERAKLEAGFFLPADKGAFLSENDCYGSPSNVSDEQTSAVYAVPEKFLRTFVKSLKAGGLRCVFAGSALTAYADLTKRLLNALSGTNAMIGKNLVVLDMEEDSLRMLLFINANLVHRQEYVLPGETSAEALLDFLDEAIRKTIDSENGDAAPDYILISGGRTEDEELAGRIAGRLNIPCRGFGSYAEQLKNALELADEMEGRKKLYTHVVALAGVPPKKQKEKNFLYGGIQKRREQRIARLVCSLILLLAAAAAAVLPVAGYGLDQKCAESRAVVERPEYAGAREQLAAHRQLEARLQNHLAEEAYMQNRNVQYAALLYQISRGFLQNADIDGVEYEKDASRMQVSFTTEDIDFFLREKERMNATGNLKIADPIVMDRAETGLWRCVITVSWNVSSAGGIEE
ncbi:MAG: hypothetical protein LBT26_06350 [Clostridiales Family XIII bacterium]|jgi:Tfp pilus assembly PilM family ATPase|nr:hypothetical protein [Clostridiales Family XIII bacterium]